MNFVKKHPLLTAFLIPFFICIIICIGNGVYPFGDYCLLHMDLYHQYLPFFNELWEKLRNGGYRYNEELGKAETAMFETEPNNPQYKEILARLNRVRDKYGIKH